MKIVCASVVRDFAMYEKCVRDTEFRRSAAAWTLL